MDRSTWEARRGLVTASRIAKIAGVSRFGGPCSAWLEMTEETFSEEETQAQERGRILEPSILAWWEEQNPGWMLDRQVFLRGGSLGDWLAATPDGIAMKDEVRRTVEAKSVAGDAVAMYAEPGTDQVPLDVLCQTQWQMGIAATQRTDVPVLLADPFAGFRFETYVVHFDEALFGHLYELGAKFHRDHILTGKPPPADDPGQQAELLARLFPRAAVEEPVQATEEIDSFGLQLAAARKEEAGVAARVEDLKNAIREFLGDKKTVIGTGWRATWGNVKGRASVNWEELVRELRVPDEVIQRHTRVSSGHRQFRISEKEGL